MWFFFVLVKAPVFSNLAVLLLVSFDLPFDFFLNKKNCFPLFSALDIPFVMFRVFLVCVYVFPI